jgi:Ca2+-binding EF-hand superfamily protein
MTVTQDELEEVREAFQLFDSEGTGFLDASELKARTLTSSSHAEIGNCYRLFFFFWCSGVFGCTVYVCELC